MCQVFLNRLTWAIQECVVHHKGGDTFIYEIFDEIMAVEALSSQGDKHLIAFDGSGVGADARKNKSLAFFGNSGVTSRA